MPPGEAAEEVPALWDPDREARGRRLHDLPESNRVPGPAVPAREALPGALEIEGLGEKNAYRFLQEGLISDAADIFDLTADRVTELEGFGQISADNLIREIEGRRRSRSRASSTRWASRAWLRQRGVARRALRDDGCPARRAAG